MFAGSVIMVGGRSSFLILNTVVHDFNGHEVNGIHGLYGKKGYDIVLCPVDKRHDITGIHDINGNFP